MTADREILRRLLESVEGGEPVALVTVVQTSRSVPRHAGSKMLVFNDRRQIGTIGGGEMESRVLDAAVASLVDGRTQQMDFDLIDPSSGDPGVCGGSVSLYVEPFMSQPNLMIIGCGHVGKALAELAHWLGFHVTAVDDRAELATADNVPTADVVLSGTFPDVFSQLATNNQTHVVLVTRSVGLDTDVIPALLESNPRSIGVMGSQRRWQTTREKLVVAGIDEEMLDRVMSPVGLDIEAETPEEIALSILAEIVQLRRSSNT